MVRPTKPCHICGSSDWWQRSASQWGPGEWLCNRCHPNPNPNPEPAPQSEGEYSPEVLALRDRVKVGNDKLTKAWLQVLQIGDPQERAYQDERWYKAKEKLEYLCLELEAKGYEDCLYIEDGRKGRRCPQSPDSSWCWVCPSTKPYWRNEND